MTGSGAVTASSLAAAEAGCSILRRGGNAVDAAVGTALASCVADACNTGLGGYGGHMVVALPDHNPVSIDFNMWVPRGVAGAYWGRSGKGPQASVVPNVVAGLDRALTELGSMDWATVTEPAIALAADGVEVNGTTRAAFDQVAGADILMECFEIETYTDPHHESRLRFRQPALAHTLEQMAANGPGWFYEGPIGNSATEILRDAGHDLTRAHWRQAPQAVAVTSAPRFTVEGVTLFSAPLGTSGSVSMFAAMAAGAELAREQPLDTADAVLAWAQMIASSWSYRFGTPDGNAVAEDELEDWIGRALAFAQPVSVPFDTGHTCHLNVMDGGGMSVAVTLTHGPAWFGARWAVPGTGVIMNAGAHILARVPPRIVGDRAYGVTNMAPTIAYVKDGAALAVGCPGARRIPTIIGLVLSRHLFGRLGLQEAVSRGRFHAETRDLATIEAGRTDRSVAAALRKGFATVADESVEEYYGPFTGIRREADGAISFGLDDRFLGYSALCPRLCASAPDAA